MSVPNIPIYNVYIASGQNRYDFTYPVISEDDLLIVITNPITYNEINLILSMDYAVTISGNTGGYITLTDSGLSKIADGEYVSLVRCPIFDQDTVLVENDPFYAKTIEAAFDKVVYQTQYLKYLLDGALLSPAGMSDVITWTDVKNAVDGVNEALSAANQAVSTANNANATANQSNATASEALGTANAALNLTQPATTTRMGIVTYATDEDISDGRSDRSITAAQLKEVIDGSIPYAEHFKGYVMLISDLQNIISPHEGDFAYVAEDGYKYIYDGAQWVNSGVVVPDQTVPKTEIVPLMSGVADIGASNTYAAGDHVHPSGPFSTPAQALAGADDTTAMTPAKVKAVAAGWAMPGHVEGLTPPANNSSINYTAEADGYFHLGATITNGFLAMYNNNNDISNFGVEIPNRGDGPAGIDAMLPARKDDIIRMTLVDTGTPTNISAHFIYAQGVAPEEA